MEIGLIGAGKIGGALARSWTQAGHRVRLTARDRRRLESIVTALGPRAEVADPVTSLGDTAVIVLAMPWLALDDILHLIPGTYPGVVIDATNPYVPDGFDPVVTGTSAGEIVARKLPGRRVVKAFNMLPDELLASPPVEKRLAMLIAGDDAAARKLVTGLVEDAGLTPIDSGPMASAKWFEPPNGPFFVQEIDPEEARRRLAELRASGS